LKEFMVSTESIVYGIFKARSEIKSALESLESEGFVSSQISLLMSASGVEEDLSDFSWLKDLGEMNVSLMGRMVVAGPLRTALEAASESDGFESILSGLHRLGLPSYEAERYQSFILNGGIWFSVQVGEDPWIDKAIGELERSGACDVASSRSHPAGRFYRAS
jgi:hypothetical protein